jgi:hypothetical protein
MKATSLLQHDISKPSHIDITRLSLLYTFRTLRLKQQIIRAPTQEAVVMYAYRLVIYYYLLARYSRIKDEAGRFIAWMDSSVPTLMHVHTHMPLLTNALFRCWKGSGVYSYITITCILPSSIRSNCILKYNQYLLCRL